MPEVATSAGPVKLTGAQLRKAEEEIGADRETVSSIAILFGVDRSTLWRAIRDRRGVTGKKEPYEQEKRLSHVPVQHAVNGTCRLRDLYTPAYSGEQP